MTAATRPISVLLVEDDDGDAYLVRDLLDTAPSIKITWVRSLAEALHSVHQYDCVLLDLGLPDTVGLDGLRKLHAAAGRIPIVVLTGLDDETQGILALAAGAQDYLLKGQVSDRGLIRTIRYAIQRRDLEDIAAELMQERIYAEENARLERGLLPQPVIFDNDLAITTRYQPGGDRMLLGGDFFDVVQSSDGTMHALIGDVAGHGPDQAAVGVALRIAWRTMIFASRSPGEIMTVLDRVLTSERHEESLLATVCSVSLVPDRSSAVAYSAGHPAPLLCRRGAWMEASINGGPSLGLIEDAEWPTNYIDLGDASRLLMYTDGAIEGYTGEGADRLGTTGLRELLDTMPPPQTHGDVVDYVIAAVTKRNGGPLTDDLAMLMLTKDALRP